MKDIFNLGMTNVPPIVVVDKLNSIKTKKAKYNLLCQVWDSDSEEFFIGLQISMDINVDFESNKIPAWEDDDPEVLLNFDEFYNFYISCKTSNLTSQEKHNKILELANKSGSREWNQFYRKILLKKLQNDLPMDIIINVLKDKSKTIETDVSVTLKRK